MILTLFFGFFFGSILQYSKLNRYNTISGMSMLKDLTMAKAIATAIGLGIILVNIEIAFGFASYHIKPLLLGGIIIGGLIFGTGMAILGYCPGTIPVSMGEGSLDAVSGFVGGLAGGIIYTLIVPSIKGLLGPDLGQISLASGLRAGTASFLVPAIIAGILLIVIAFLLNRFERSQSRNWLYSGIGLAVLTALIFNKSIFDRVLGASTFYPYFGDLIAGLKGSSYFQGSVGAGKWEMMFLAGAFLSGLILSLVRKDFSFTLIHDNWRKYKNDSNGSRLFWSFTGGFLLLIGARMAGGCTSGHIISGGMQLALSSWLFAIFVFGAFLVTGKLFYRKG